MQRDLSCDGGSSGLADAQMRREVKSGAGVVREGFLEEGAAAERQARVVPKE